VRFRALLPAKRFFAKVGDFSVYVQILSLKAIQLLRHGKHFSAQRRADLELRRAGIIVELPDLVAGIVRIFLHGDFAASSIQFAGVNPKSPCKKIRTMPATRSGSSTMIPARRSSRSARRCALKCLPMAQQLNRFQGQDLDVHRKIANLGEKNVSLGAGLGNARGEFNYTLNSTPASFCKSSRA